MRLSFLLGWGLSGLILSHSPVQTVFADAPKPPAPESSEPLVLNHAGAPTLSQHWPGWRGWNTTGVYEGPALPEGWVKDGNVAAEWVRNIPGRGESSPIVWGDSVCLTYTIDENSESWLHAACYLAKNGDTKWDRRLQAVRGTKHEYNSYGSSTPTTDGKLLYVAIGFETGNLYALDLADGTEVWKRSLGNLSHEYGTSVGPILYKDLVIQLCDSERRSSIAAFERVTGKLVWETARKSTGSWGTPVVVSTKARDTIVVPGGSPGRWVEGYVRAYDPESGDELWNVPGTTAYVCSSPLLGKNNIFCASGRPTGPIHAIRPVVGNGETRVRWTESRGGAYVPTGIFYKGLIYILSDNGVVSAYEPGEKEARRLYQKRLPGEYAASLIASNGRLYAFGLGGEVNVFAAGKEFKWLVGDKMPESVYATPAMANGRFYIRSHSKLWAIGGAPKNRARIVVPAPDPAPAPPPAPAR